MGAIGPLHRLTGGIKQPRCVCVATIKKVVEYDNVVASGTMRGCASFKVYSFMLCCIAIW